MPSKNEADYSMRPVKKYLVPAPLLWHRDGSSLGCRGLRRDGICQTLREGRPHSAPERQFKLRAAQFRVHLLEDIGGPSHTNTFVYTVLAHQHIDNDSLARAADEML